MLFTIFRLIFWIVAFIICILFIMKSHITYKRRCYIVSFVIAVTFMIISAFIPIENTFMTFSSPKSAFNYINSGEVKLVVNGENTDLVVGVKNDTDVYAIIPKSNNGWKLGVGLDTKRIIQKISNGIIIYVYQYKNSEDYYITVLNTNGGKSELVDNRNSKFYTIDKTNDNHGKTFYTYYAYIQNFDEQYVLNVNGESISVANKKN